MLICRVNEFKKENVVADETVVDGSKEKCVLCIIDEFCFLVNEED